VRADHGGVITNIHDGDQRGGRSESRPRLACLAVGDAVSQPACDVALLPWSLAGGLTVELEA
jgi:hypothetical protein